MVKGCAQFQDQVPQKSEKHDIWRAFFWGNDHAGKRTATKDRYHTVCEPVINSRQRFGKPAK